MRKLLMYVKSPNIKIQGCTKVEFYTNIFSSVTPQIIFMMLIAEKRSQISL